MEGCVLAARHHSSPSKVLNTATIATEAATPMVARCPVQNSRSRRSVREMRRRGAAAGRVGTWSGLRSARMGAGAALLSLFLGPHGRVQRAQLPAQGLPLPGGPQGGRQLREVGVAQGQGGVGGQAGLQVGAGGCRQFAPVVGFKEGVVVGFGHHKSNSCGHQKRDSSSL